MSCFLRKHSAQNFLSLDNHSQFMCYPLLGGEYLTSNSNHLYTTVYAYGQKQCIPAKWVIFSALQIGSNSIQISVWNICIGATVRMSMLILTERSFWSRNYHVMKHTWKPFTYVMHIDETIP